LSARSAWSREALAEAGFEGWITFGELAEGLAAIAAGPGVYIVVRPPAGTLEYRAANPGGRFKGRDPTVSPEALSANWVDGAEVIYIGEAGDLRRRLREYMRFGEGAPIGHWGGRLIWQLADSPSALVAWRQTPGRDPKQVESEMIAEFRESWGKPPFANEPHRLGR